jgi:hypothetical protein
MADAREKQFVSQSDEFVERALREVGVARLSAVPSVSTRLALALSPIIVKDYRNLTVDTRQAMASAYHGEFGVAYCIVLNPHDPPKTTHPLLDLSAALTDDFGLQHPLTHPMEGHAEAVSRFGAPDGTLKIYDLDTKDGHAGYREQAETSEMFSAHNDGLGYGGAVQTVAFYMDSAPLWGGFTYFQNIIRLSLDLARDDFDAFRSLFLPDAIQAIRPRGKGAIKVKSPVLYLNVARRPQCFYRVTTGEYRIDWRSGVDALDRARQFIDSHTHPFSSGSTFVHLDSKGHCCFVRNEAVVHGRTPFRDDYTSGQRRVLARKWFMRDGKDAVYKHVPGIEIVRDYAGLYPEQFGEDVLTGEWNYNKDQGLNIRNR